MLTLPCSYSGTFFAWISAAAVPPDLCGLRLESAAAHLADITGLNSADDTLNAIFADFCIGK